VPYHHYAAEVEVVYGRYLAQVVYAGSHVEEGAGPAAAWVTDATVFDAPGRHAAGG
jgi:hypothetical protein